MARRYWFAVTIEHDVTGIRGTNYIQSVFTPTAEDVDLSAGWSVVGFRCWGENTRFPSLPNYRGR